VRQFTHDIWNLRYVHLVIKDQYSDTGTNFQQRGGDQESICT